MGRPEIVTPRLRLKGFELSDAEDVFAYGSDPEVSRFTTWQTHRSIEDARSYIGKLLDDGPHEPCWAIRLRDETRVIGAIEMGPCDKAEAGLHYVLAKPYWNRGLMSEAAGAVLRWGFESYPNLNRVVTSAVAENFGSRRVMEKCGLRFERTRPEKWAKLPEPVELAVYSITRQQWLENRAS